MGYIDGLGSYYQGDRQGNDIEVPDRPNPTDIWDGEAWQPGPMPVPSAVTPLQARRALRAAGLLAKVNEAAIAAGGDVQLAWEYSATVERASPFVAALAGALQLTSGQIDDLFREAAQLD